MDDSIYRDQAGRRLDGWYGLGLVPHAFTIEQVPIHYSSPLMLGRSWSKPRGYVCIQAGAKIHCILEPPHRIREPEATHEVHIRLLRHHAM